MPPRLGHAPSLSTGAAAAQQGMVRIHRGAEVRYVWPVHVAGWLSSGWRAGEDRTGGTATPSAAAAAVPATAKQPPAAAPQASVLAEATEAVSEPIDAHLPTNLLDLDLEPVAANPQVSAPAEAPQQQAIEPNDAEPASFAASGQAEVDAEGTATAANEDIAAPAAAELSQEEPTPPPAPARRGRPRKVRPEAQAEPATEPVTEAGSEQQPPATTEISEHSEPALVLSTDGDDPFGLDPLL